ncbi:MAG: prepilin-type N-terminal cleavage/methylation domain-containing protein [Hydrogenoanaerobacterium sp.]
MKTKKGFTLVEVIVVLVILAILAAISIPSLTGYIDEAKDKAIIANGRNAFVAAQAIASQEYAKPTPDYTQATGTVGKANVEKYIGATLPTGSTIVSTMTGGKISKFVYTEGAKTVTFENGEVTVGETPKP